MLRRRIHKPKLALRALVLTLPWLFMLGARILADLLDRAASRVESGFTVMTAWVPDAEYYVDDGSPREDEDLWNHQ